MRELKERIFSALLGVLFFVIFQPLELPTDEMIFLFIPVFCIVSILTCIISELFVTYIFRLPNKIELGYSHIKRHYRAFSPVNAILQTLSVASLFQIFCPELDCFSFNGLIHIFLCLACIVFVQRLYWSNVYKNRIMAQELEEAIRINGVLQERERTHKKESQVTEDALQNIHLEGNTRENIDFSLPDFLFAESRGNYVAVHHLEKGIVSVSEIRISIKEVCELLALQPNVMRCHRAYIVNLANVLDVERRPNGLVLNMKHKHLQVPVSKSYLQAVKERLQNPDL